MSSERKSAVQLHCLSSIAPRAYHAHGEVEVLHVTRGSVAFGMHGQLRRLQEGQMVLCAPYVVHGVETASTDAAGLLLRFDPMLYGQQAPQALEWLSCASGWDESCTPDTVLRLSTLIRTTEAELQAEQPGWELVVSAQLWQLAALAARELPRLGTRASALCSAQAILRELALHYTGELTLCSCAEAVGVSMHYLSVLFAQKFGVSFSPYVSALRVRHAAWLLRNAPTCSIAEAAKAAGFGSIQTFNRVFRQQIGLSPREFRQQSPHILGAEQETAT